MLKLYNKFPDPCQVAVQRVRHLLDLLRIERDQLMHHAEAGVQHDEGTQKPIKSLPTDPKRLEYIIKVLGHRMKKEFQEINFVSLRDFPMKAIKKTSRNGYMLNRCLLDHVVI